MHPEILLNVCGPTEPELGSKTQAPGQVEALGPRAQPHTCLRAQPEGYPLPVPQKARAMCVSALKLRSKPQDSSKQASEIKQPVIKSEGKQKQNSFPHLLGETEEELFGLHFFMTDFFLMWPLTHFFLNSYKKQQKRNTQKYYFPT